MAEPSGKYFFALFENAVQIFLKNLSAICILWVIVYIPVSIITYLMPLDYFINTNNVQAAVMINLAASMVKMFFAPLAVMGNAYLTMEFKMGRKSTLSGVMEQVFSRTGTVFFASIVYMSILFVVMAFTSLQFFNILFILLFLFFLVAYGYYPQAIILNGRRGVSSLFYSQLIVKGFWFKIFLIRILSEIALLIVALLIAPAVQVVGHFSVIMILFSALPFILAGYFDIVQTLLYLHIHKVKGLETFLNMNGDK